MSEPCKFFDVQSILHNIEQHFTDKLVDSGVEAARIYFNDDVRVNDLYVLVEVAGIEINKGDPNQHQYWTRSKAWTITYNITAANYSVSDVSNFIGKLGYHQKYEQCTDEYRYYIMNITTDTILKEKNRINSTKIVVVIQPLGMIGGV